MRAIQVISRGVRWCWCHFESVALFLFLTWWGPFFIGTYIYQHKWSQAARVSLPFIVVGVIYWSIWWGVPRSARAVWQAAQRTAATPLGNRLVIGVNRALGKLHTPAERGIRAFGLTVRWILLAGLAWYSISTMPSITEVPIAQLTLGVLAQAGAHVIGLSLIMKWAFSSDVDYNAWGQFALMLTTLIGFLALAYGVSSFMEAKHL